MDMHMPGPLKKKQLLFQQSHFLTSRATSAFLSCSCDGFDKEHGRTVKQLSVNLVWVG